METSNEAMNFREMKQKYLRVEIVEKGYDGIKFSEYLDSKKTDGKNKKEPI